MVKPKRVKETRALYRVKRKANAARTTKAKVNLRWADVENSTAPIILEKDGKPAAVVIKYEDYQHSALAQAERKQVAWQEMEKLLAQVHSRTQNFSVEEIEADITAAREEVRAIHRTLRSS